MTPVLVQLIAPADGGYAVVRLQVNERPATLSAVVPLLERLGLEVLDESSDHATAPDGSKVFTHTLGVRHAAGGDGQTCRHFGRLPHFYARIIGAVKYH